MTRGRDRAGSCLFLLGVLVALPVAGAKLLGTGWATIGAAYAIWLALLAIIALILAASAPRGRIGEMLGWTAILGLFWTIPAIVVLLIVLRIAGLP